MSKDVSQRLANEEPERQSTMRSAQGRATATQRSPGLSTWSTRTGGAEAHLRTRRSRRCLKRKYVHRMNQQITTRERQGTRWLLLSTALLALLFLLLLSTILVGVIGLTSITQKRLGAELVTLQDILPGDSLKMYDRHGTLIYQMTQKGLQTSVPLSQVSHDLINAEVAIEDQSFWKNVGFDITGIMRAAIADLMHGRVVAGGSTITQQLIKNALVGNRDTLLRKLQEVILAPQMTRRYTKQQILSMYLNTIYYGEQSYGVDAAAFRYFDLKDTPIHSATSQLDLAQAAMLAGLPQSPVIHDPFLHPHNSRTRMKEVLRQMLEQGYITGGQENAAIAEARKPGFLHRGIVRNRSAPHFVRYTLHELASHLHVRVGDLARAGLVVHTTLDLPLQNQTLHIAQQQVAQMNVAHHLSNAAEVVINQHTGGIRVLLGNVNPDDPHDGRFDIASQGLRQPGSSFKPFVYATAFAEGLSPGMPVMDRPFAIPLCCGLPPYEPHNYDLQYHGLISYRAALQNSLNIPAVKLLTRVGVQPALNTALSMGITAYNGTPNYTMVLGSLGVHLLDETSAYGAFGNGGIHVPPHTIQVVTDPWGKVLYRPDTRGTQVVSPQVAYLMTHVLSDNAARTMEFGKCSALSLYANTQAQCSVGNPGITRQAAVKTGTSQNFMDNWTVGYTTDFVVGVWAGNMDNSPMVNVEGVDGAGPIWHQSMLLAEQGYPIKNFVPPGGMEQRTVHYPGLTTTDWYIDGLPEDATRWDT